MRRRERRPKKPKVPKNFFVLSEKRKKFKKEKQFSSSLQHTQRSYSCPLFRIHTQEQEQQSTKNKNTKND